MSFNGYFGRKSRWVCAYKGYYLNAFFLKRRYAGSSKRISPLTQNDCSYKALTLGVSARFKGRYGKQKYSLSLRRMHGTGVLESISADACQLLYSTTYHRV